MARANLAATPRKIPVFLVPWALRFHLHSNLKVSFQDTNPTHVAFTLQGLDCRVALAPPRSSPLCCLTRRGTQLVAPM